MSKPTRADLLSMANARLPDVVAPGLRVLFCGINPGLYSAWVGHHFGRPGNRFWPALHAGGFTPTLFAPNQQRELLPLGFGITNVVARASAAADELAADEIVHGGKVLVRKVKRLAPRFLAVLGVTAYRTAFAKPDAVIGRQPDAIGDTTVWVLPNPSGLNAHYSAARLGELFRELRDAAEQAMGRG